MRLAVGNSWGGADAPAVADCACQGVGVAQEAVGPADLPQLHQPADVVELTVMPATSTLG